MAWSATPSVCLCSGALCSTRAEGMAEGRGRVHCFNRPARGRAMVASDCPPPTPDPPTKGTIVGNNEIHRWDHLMGPFFGTKSCHPPRPNTPVKHSRGTSLYPPPCPPSNTPVKHSPGTSLYPPPAPPQHPRQAQPWEQPPPPPPEALSCTRFASTRRCAVLGVVGAAPPPPRPEALSC